MKKYILKISALIIMFTAITIGVCIAKTGTIQNSDFLNLRQSASTSSNLLVKMPGDAKFEILSDEGDWYKVKYQTYTGYVSKEYVKVLPETPTTTEITSNIPPKTNAKGIIKKSTQIYSLPLVNAIKIGNLSTNNEVLVISMAGKWAYIQNDSISGWILIDNINGKE